MNFHINTVTFISAIEQVRIECRRADDNAKTCKEFCNALRQIRDTAQSALQMSWLMEPLK